MFLISLPSCISNSFRLPSSLAEASTFESSRQLMRGNRRFVPLQIQVFPGRRGFPDEQAGAAVGRGQQHAVGTEFDGIDPIGVLLDLGDLLERLRGKDAHDFLRAAQRDQRLIVVDVAGQHGVELVADLETRRPVFTSNATAAARLAAAPAADQAAANRCG